MSTQDEFTKRFRIETMSAKGQCIVRVLEDDPDLAMLKYVEMASEDFGRLYGIGAFVALTDNDLKLDVARISDGIGTYLVQSRKNEGRVALQKAERKYKFATEAKTLAGEINRFLGAFGRETKSEISDHSGWEGPCSVQH